MDATPAARGQVAAPAAEIYDRFFVPALFGQWVEPMLEIAGVAAGDRVLDVGCGTGVLARGAARLPGVEVVGLDPNEGMLAVARRSSEPVRWHRGVAEHLPFPAGSFDRVVSQFVLMFLDDRRRGIEEAARVLAPGGTAAFATWASIEESPGYAAMVELLQRVVGPDGADALRAPFVLGTPEIVRGLLTPVFPEVSVVRRDGTARFASIEAWIHTDIRGWTLSDAIDETTYARLLAAARLALVDHTDEHGRVAFPAPALIARASTAPAG